MKTDLEKMIPNVFPENKVFCLTPEDKIDNWIKIIKDKAKEGNKVKLYSDIESTGFAYWARGRNLYDPNIDKKLLEKDAIKFFIGINAYKNEEFDLNLNNPFCENEYFDFKNISDFAICFLNKNEIVNLNNEFSDFNNVVSSNIKEDIDNKVNVIINYLKANNKFEEFKSNALKEVKKLEKKAFVYIEKEAKELSGKRDRMIEFAFVTCYENKDGEVFLLKDENEDLIYFHEFVFPNNDGKTKEEQMINDMPIIPYLIHKTDFEFLKGEKVHPFLNIKLDKTAPNAGDLFRFIFKLFNTENESPKDKILLTENIEMFYHNGNGFDVPFIDAEMDKFFENVKLRDLTKVFDTLKIAKEIVPSDIQKFIAACQYNKNFGGKEELKSIESIAIAPTSKSLDNIKRLATFLIHFDLDKPKNMYLKAQNIFFEKFKNYFETEEIAWNKFENMVEYNQSRDISIDLKKGFPKPKKKGDELDVLLERYSKFLDGKKEYLQSLNKIKKYENIYKNLSNIKENIEKNKFLKDALFRLNNIDRSAHGARVDSQLFMDAFIVLENALYLKPKMAKEKRNIKLDDLKIPDDIQKKFADLINTK